MRRRRRRAARRRDEEETQRRRRGTGSRRPRRGDRRRLRPQRHAQHYHARTAMSTVRIRREVSAAQDQWLEPRPRAAAGIGDAETKTRPRMIRSCRRFHGAAHCRRRAGPTTHRRSSKRRVGEVGARRVAEAVAGSEGRALGNHRAPAHLAPPSSGRKRPPHLPRARRAAAGVITLSPRSGAYASTLDHHAARDDGIALSRSRAAAPS